MTVSVMHQVYDWSTDQTSESHDFSIEDYFWTKEGKRALFRTQHSKRTVIPIVGLQGTGKTALLKALRHSVQVPEGFEVAHWKWAANWWETTKDELTIEDNYFEKLWSILINEHADLIQNRLKISPLTVKSMLGDWRRASGGARNQAQDALDKLMDFEGVERLLGAKTVDKIREGLVKSFLGKVFYIFIDLPDYTKKDARLISKDLDNLQHMWVDFMEDKTRQTLTILTVQKEIYQRRPHYWLNKFIPIELKPLKPEELIEAYRLKWKTIAPFTEESLRLIAELSRGIFRRFIKYIHLTIEEYQINEKEPPINVQDVEKSVPFDILLGDMELELADIFTQQGHKVQAVKVLQVLRDKTFTQKEIAEKLDITESLLVGIIRKLELYGYIARTRGEGCAWLVKLA